MRHPVLAAHPRRSARKWLNLFIGLLMMLSLFYAAVFLYWAALGVLAPLLDKRWGPDGQDITLELCAAAFCFGFCWLAGEVVGWLNRRGTP